MMIQAEQASFRLIVKIQIKTCHPTSLPWGSELELGTEHDPTGAAIL